MDFDIKYYNEETASDKAKLINQFNFTKLVLEASRNGILVSPLETTNEEWKRYKTGEERHIHFTANAVELIKNFINEFKQENNNQEPKWFSLIGSAHLTTNNFQNNLIQGLADVFDVFPIVISDSKNNQIVEEGNNFYIGTVDKEIAEGVYKELENVLQIKSPINKSLQLEEITKSLTLSKSEGKSSKKPDETFDENIERLIAKENTDYY